MKLTIFGSSRISREIQLKSEVASYEEGAWSIRRIEQLVHSPVRESTLSNKVTPSEMTVLRFPDATSPL